MIELSQQEYEKYRRKGQKTNEGYIFTNPKNKKKIIKVIEPRTNSQNYLKNKIYTIGALIQSYDYLHDLHMAIPEEGVIIDYDARGYSTQRIKGEELLFSLTNPNIPLETKIDYFKRTLIIYVTKSVLLFLYSLYCFFSNPLYCIIY